MALKTLVKANSISNLTDARYFAAHEVEWMGFCFDPTSTEFIQPQLARGIRDWVVGPKVVAEFGNQTIEEIQSLIEFLRPDFIQLNTEFVMNEEFEKPLMIKTQSVSETEFMKWKSHASLFLVSDSNILDAKSALKELSNKFQFLIDASAIRSDITTALSETGATGIYVAGGSEEKPGVKNYAVLDEIFESLTLS